MATEATASCQDRVTLALHQMKNVQLVHDAEKGQYDNNLAALVATGREMFRLENWNRLPGKRPERWPWPMMLKSIWRIRIS